MGRVEGVEKEEGASDARFPLCLVPMLQSDNLEYRNLTADRLAA